jgi:hypothetical protein
MRQPRDRAHLFLPQADRKLYVPHNSGFEAEAPSAPQSRQVHGEQLLAMVKAAVKEAHHSREKAGYAINGATPGVYLQVESTPESPLNIQDLERRNIEIMAVTNPATAEGGNNPKQIATLFMPDKAVDSFCSRLDTYANDTPKKERESRYEKAFDPVKRVSLAAIKSLWTDNPRHFPNVNQAIWMEVWLHRSDGMEFQRFQEYAKLNEILLGGRRLTFDQRIVLLAKASPEQLSGCLFLLGDLAELRMAPQTAEFVWGMGIDEQRAWAEDLLTRTHTAAPSAPAVCVIDTGVSQRHPLLEHSLSRDDCHTCDPQWGVLDNEGHGTEMAGIALYGDLLQPLETSAEIRLFHRLESVKILPSEGSNHPDLYGALCAMAASSVEVEAPDRTRVYSMAITSPKSNQDGTPSSWSAAIDALAAGRGFDATRDGLLLFESESTARRRLFVLSAGNVPDDDVKREGTNYLKRCDDEIIQDPAQAWNALTVGAYTDKVHLPHKDWADYQTLAKQGDLSPWSCTGIAFDKEWPNKPDLVMEGGNALLNPQGEVDLGCYELGLLSTNYQFQTRLFSATNATSAACALAARMAANIAAANSSLWPETIRALMVHSARWTEQMQRHLPGKAAKRTKAEYLKLLRRYGYGVPDLQRALFSAKDALTLIAQDRLMPYAKGGSGMKMHQLHLYRLPWPRDVLLDLGSQEVELRITLSYFIEPNPGRSGWLHRHRYASSRLRFDLKRSEETEEEFEKRMNQAALSKDEKKQKAGSDSRNWRFGQQSRERGSLHSDVLLCTAAELADCNLLGVVPKSGWWKDQPRRIWGFEATVPYALIVSIETDAQNVDIWTPVSQLLQVPAAELLVEA